MTGASGGTLEISGGDTNDQVNIEYDSDDWTQTVDGSTGIVSFTATDLSGIQVDIDPDNVQINPVDIDI